MGEDNDSHYSWKYDIKDCSKKGQVLKNQIIQIRKLVKLIESLNKSIESFTLPLYSEVILKSQYIANHLIITVFSSNNHQLKSFLEKETGIFHPLNIRLRKNEWIASTIQNPIKNHGSKNRPKISKNYWYNWTSFITEIHHETQVSNEGEWRPSRKWGNKKVINRRIVIEINLNVLEEYKSELFALANDYSTTKTFRRIISQYKSQVKKGKITQSSLEEFLFFWNDICNLPDRKKDLFQLQQTYTVKNIVKSLDECLKEAILSVNIKKFPTNTVLTRIMNTNKEYSRFDLIKSSSDMTKIKICDFIGKNCYLKARRVGMEADNETYGAIELFADQLEYLQKNNILDSPLVRILGLDEDVVKKSNLELKWGYSGTYKGLFQDIGDYFGPDIVVKDLDDRIIAIIQLKGKTQYHGLLCNGTFIELMELKKYQACSEIKVAFVNIVVKDAYIDTEGRIIQSGSLVYEWFVNERHLQVKSSLKSKKLWKRVLNIGNDMKRLISIDPLLLRNLRKPVIWKSIYDKTLNKTLDYVFDLKEYVEIIETSYLSFNTFIEVSNNVPDKTDIIKHLDILNSKLKPIVEKIGKAKGYSSPKAFKYDWEDALIRFFVESIMNYFE